MSVTGQYYGTTFSNSETDFARKSAFLSNHAGTPVQQLLKMGLNWDTHQPSSASCIRVFRGKISKRLTTDTISKGFRSGGEMKAFCVHPIFLKVADARLKEGRSFTGDALSARTNLVTRRTIRKNFHSAGQMGVFCVPSILLTRS